MHGMMDEEEEATEEKPKAGKSKIAIAIGKLPADPTKEKEDEDYSESVSPEEVSAMKLFEKAADPEAKARALKLFLEACGAV